MPVISCECNFLCGEELPVRRISCATITFAENFLCGEFPVRTISCSGSDNFL